MWNSSILWNEKNEIISYIKFTRDLSIHQKSELLAHLKTPLWDKLKWSFLWIWWSKHIDLFAVLDNYIEDVDTKDLLVQWYESYKDYNSKMDRQSDFWDTERDSVVIPNLSPRVIQSLKRNTEKYSLPTKHINLMAWIVKLHSTEKSSRIFTESYLPLIKKIVRRSPSSWTNIVKLVVLSYQCNNYSDLYHKFSMFSIIEDTEKMAWAIDDYLSELVKSSSVE